MCKKVIFRRICTSRRFYFGLACVVRLGNNHSDESDYMTENEYSVPEEVDADNSSEEYNSIFEGSKGREFGRMRSIGQPRYGSVTNDDEEILNSSSAFTSHSKRHRYGASRQESYRIACGRRGSMKPCGFYSHREDILPPAPVPTPQGVLVPIPNSVPPPPPPRQNIPPSGLPKKMTKRGKLVKQASVVPIITDSSGAMKMTFWM